MNLAMQQLFDGQREEAKSNLIPIAYNPHGGGMAEVARSTMERIDKEPEWRGQGAPEASDEGEEQPAG
jgi:hypothetical protein